jgi:hypothetical protein
VARNYVLMSVRRLSADPEQEVEGKREPPMLLFFDDAIPAELVRVRFAIGEALKMLGTKRLQVRSCHVCRRVEGLELPSQGEED